MHALKTPSFFRPSSRPSSPVPTTVPSRPDSGVGFDALLPLSRPSSRGPLNRLALTSRKRPAPPTTPATQTLVQDGSYLEALSLKLSEAVSKALAQPTSTPATGETLVNGKRALPSGRGTALGNLIASELEASASNPHLHRAIIRSLHRPLSVLLTNLSTQLLPLVSSPQFTAHLSYSTPSAAQHHAVAFATFTAELLEVFDARGLAQAGDLRVGMATDNLRSLREGFESLIARVINPLIQGIKNEVVPLIEALEHPPANASLPTYAKQGFSHPKGAHVSLHPSIMTLQSSIPLYVRHLTRCVTPPTVTSQTALATLLISLIWRSIVALSHRPRASSPAIPAQATAQPHFTASSARKKLLGSSTTPPSTPPSSRFTIKLPPSRPPSPPPALTPSAACDARALCDLLGTFPRPTENSRFALAREAVDEAFSSLKALCALFDAEIREDYEHLDVLTTDLPTVIALPVLLRIFAVRPRDGTGSDDAINVTCLLQLTEEEYRSACLSGFGRAEDCGPLVAKRVLDALVEQHDARWDILIQWLEGRVSP